ncbi:barstar family protein [Mycobacterium angelicum]|uniref:barstar family protein n=1 Tax=Mycobacterium angelicum TaxID=470074 RepID=UPI0014762306|nr:barstar family protein [Mycobacterium angelicum]MCV7198469.1 barstar family protein [Mycobacterium angelicum]
MGIQAEIPSTWAVPPDIEVRAIDGARVNSVDALFDAFAAAWHFPPWFGRNKDAFNDFIRDLDNMLNTATGKPPARGYLSVITDAHLFLVDQPEDFFWFASKMPVYRNYYRDEARPPAAFALILTAPADQLDAVRERWLTVGIDVATVTL